MPEYLGELASLEASVEELATIIKAATAPVDGDEDDEAEESLSEADLKKLKAQLTADKKRLKAERAGFVTRLLAATRDLQASDARELVLGAFYSALLVEAHQRVERHRREVVSAFETWWDKYKVTLLSLEESRDSAAQALTRHLGALGYE